MSILLEFESTLFRLIFIKHNLLILEGIFGFPAGPLPVSKYLSKMPKWRILKLMKIGPWYPPPVAYCALASYSWCGAEIADWFVDKEV